LRFFHDGQLEGRKIKVPVHLCRGPVEIDDAAIVAFYNKLIGLLNMDVFKRGKWILLENRQAWTDNPTFENFIPMSWESDNRKRYLIVVNYASYQGQCSLFLPWDDIEDQNLLLIDLFSEEEFERSGNNIISSGLYVDLPAWGFHFFQLVYRSLVGT